jgi:hypothetical protein
MDPKIPRKKDTTKNICLDVNNSLPDTCIDCNIINDSNEKNVSFFGVENDTHLGSQNSAQKRYNEFNCEICNFITSRKQNYDKHLLTKKHVLNSNNCVKPNRQFHCNACNITFNKNIDLVRHSESKKHLINSGKIKNENIFNCNLCCLVFDKKSAYNKHIVSKSHIFKDTERNKPYECNYCFEKFTEYSIYSIHTEKCYSIYNNDTYSTQKLDQAALIVKNNETDKEAASSGATNYIEIINKLLSENQDLRNFLIDQSKEQNEIMNKLVEITKTTSITNATMTNNINGNLINNNQKFNINVFLNEQCKDAINLPEFIENIEVSHEDLENNAQLGFVNGISKIILDNLKQLSIYERPIHCTDLKRETVYVRCDDKWSKENSADKLNSAIRDISYKSIGVLNEWKQSNPDYQDINSEFSDKCIVMSKNTLAGYDRDTYYPKVIRIISKETVIDRNSIEN